jgi:hypothetical protein
VTGGGFLKYEGALNYPPENLHFRFRLLVPLLLLQFRNAFLNSLKGSKQPERAIN